MADAASPSSSPARARRGGAPLAIGVIVVLFAAVPTAAQVFNDPFLVSVFSRVVVFAIVAAALNFVLGYGGLVSLMHAALFGVGAYTVGILEANDFNATPFLIGPLSIPGTSDLLIAAPVAAVVTAAFAAVTGLLSLRTSGTYFLMITLAFNQMLFYFFVSLQPYGGADGLQILGNLTFAGIAVRPLPLYYVCVAALGVTLLALQRLVGSRFGVVLRATAHNERRAQALGLPVLRYKLAAFVISGVIAGLAGVLWTASQQFVSPADMAWTRSADLVVMVVLGGAMTVWGPVIGTTIFLVMELVLTSWTTYWQIPLGLLIIAVVVVLRNGLADLPSLFRPRGRVGHD